MNKSIKNQTLDEFLVNLSSNSPTPGGGAVAAIAGAYGASLVSMVANLTINKKKYIKHKGELRIILEKAETAKKQLLKRADEDCRAFDLVIKAYKTKKGMEESLKIACRIPLEVYRLSLSLIPLAERLLEIGNKNAKSDAKVARYMINASIKSAKENILINLKEIKDEKFKKSVNSKLI